MKDQKISNTWYQIYYYFNFNIFMILVQRYSADFKKWGFHRHQMKERSRKVGREHSNNLLSYAFKQAYFNLTHLCLCSKLLILTPWKSTPGYDQGLFFVGDISGPTAKSEEYEKCYAFAIFSDSTNAA